MLCRSSKSRQRQKKTITKHTIDDAIASTSMDSHSFSMIPNEDHNGFFMENCQYLLSFPDLKFTPTQNEKIIFTEDNIPVRKIYFSAQSTKVSVALIKRVPRHHQSETEVFLVMRNSFTRFMGTACTSLSVSNGNG